MSFLRMHSYSTYRATGKHGNAGTETGTGTGTETTKRAGDREPVSSPYSRQESQMSLN